jgi:hypothetical protein
MKNKFKSYAEKTFYTLGFIGIFDMIVQFASDKSVRPIRMFLSLFS